MIRPRVKTYALFRTGLLAALVLCAAAGYSHAALIAYIPFDESASGTGTAFDQAPLELGANNGSFLGTATRTSGLIGTGAAIYGGANPSVSLGNFGGSVTASSGVSVEILFNSATLSGTLQSLFRKEDGSNRILLGFQDPANVNNNSGQFVGGTDEGIAGLSFGINENGTYRELDVELDGNDGRPTFASLNNGSLHHVVATYDGATGAKKIYIDGALIASVTTTTGVINWGGTGTGEIGSRLATNEFFSGKLDEFALYTHALDAQTVAAHWANVQQGNSYFAAVPSPAALPSGLLLMACTLGARRRHHE